MRETCHSEPCLHCEDTVIMFVFSEPKVVAKVKRQVWTAAATDAFFEGLCQVSLDCLQSKDTHVTFMGCGFTSGGQESGYVLCAAVREIKARKHCIKPLPLVLKDKRDCLSEGERYS